MMELPKKISRRIIAHICHRCGKKRSQEKRGEGEGEEEDEGGRREEEEGGRTEGGIRAFSLERLIETN